MHRGIHRGGVIYLAAFITFLGCADERGGLTQPELSALTICNNSVTSGEVDSPVPPWSGGHQALFTIKNNLSQTTTGSVTCSMTYPLLCNGVSPNQVTLGPGASQGVTVTFSTRNAGTGTLIASSCGGSKSVSVVVQ
jgi:hypothetical protein